MAVLAGWAVAFPIRSAEARTQIRELSELWSTAYALDIERVGLQAGLVGAAAGTDDGLLRLAYAALDRQEADDLSNLRARLPGSLSLDTGVRHVHRALAVALSDESDDLRAAAHGWLAAAVPLDRSAATVLAVANAERQLHREAAALGVKPVPAPTPPALDAADATFAILTKLDDRPLPLRLLATQSSGLVIDDLTTGQSSGVNARPAGSSLTPGFLLARSSFAVAGGLTGKRAAIIQYDNVTAPFAFIDGTVIDVDAALRPDAFWVTRPHGSVVELDGAGRRVGGPWTLPVGSVLDGQVPAGLVISDGHNVDRPSFRGIEVWDPATSHTAGIVSSDPDAAVLSVRAGIVAWAIVNSAGTRPAAHFTSTLSGQTVTIAVSLANPPEPGTYALSPDGSLFSAVFSGRSAGGDLGSVNTTTGAFRLLEANFDKAGRRPNLVWDTSGRWLVALEDKGNGAAFDSTTHETDPLRLGIATGVALIAIPGA